MATQTRFLPSSLSLFCFLVSAGASALGFGHRAQHPFTEFTERVDEVLPAALNPMPCVDMQAGLAAPLFDFGISFNIPMNGSTYKNNEDYTAVLATNPNIGSVTLVNSGDFRLGSGAVIEMGLDEGFEFWLQDRYSGIEFGNLAPGSGVEVLPVPLPNGLAYGSGFGEDWGFALRFKSGPKNSDTADELNLNHLRFTCLPQDQQQDYQSPKLIQFGRVYDGLLLGYDVATKQGDAIDFQTPNLRTAPAEQVGRGPKDIAVAVWGYRSRSEPSDELAVYMHCQDDPVNQYRYESLGGHQAFLMIPSTDDCSAYDIFIEDVGHVVPFAGVDQRVSASATTFKILVTRPAPSHVYDLTIDTDYEASSADMDQIAQTCLDAAKLWFTLNQGQAFIGRIYAYNTGKCDCGSKCDPVSVCFHRERESSDDGNPILAAIDGTPRSHCIMPPSLNNLLGGTGGMVDLYREASDSGTWCKAGEYCAHTLAHELGHCADGLKDEYSYLNDKTFCGHTWMSDASQSIPVFCTRLNHGRDGESSPPTSAEVSRAIAEAAILSSFGGWLGATAAVGLNLPLFINYASYPQHSGADHLYDQGLDANTVLNATPMTLDFTSPDDTHGADPLHRDPDAVDGFSFSNLISVSFQ